MPWIDFLICLLFGIFGVHKFREKQIGLGLLYLFTAGLLGIGWLVDCIKYLIAAIGSTTKTTTQYEPYQPFSNSPMPQNYNNEPIRSEYNMPNTDYNYNPTDNTVVTEESFNKRKNTIRWICSGIALFFALVYMPSIATIFAVLCAIVIAPIPKVQTLINTYIKRKYKIIIAISLAIIAVICAPKTSVDNNSIKTKDSDITSTQSVVETTGKSENKKSVSQSETKPSTEAPTEKPTETIHEHTFSDATCTSPKTCSECGETQGNATGHSFKSATCTKAKECSKCRKTEGSPLGHSYSYGSCSICGKSDPDYVVEDNYSSNTVWIPTKGGTKYHSHSGCSSMDGPIEVSEEEAISQGFEACKKCY